MGPFCPNLGKQELSRKICSGQFLAFIVLYLHAQYREKLMNEFKEKVFDTFFPFWANENLPEKSSSVTFECLWSPNFIIKKSEKFMTQF